MVSVEKWAMWDSAVEVDVTEGAALPTAHALIAAAIDETEAVCDLRRGDAETARSEMIEHVRHAGEQLASHIDARIAGQA